MSFQWRGVSQEGCKRCKKIKEQEKTGRKAGRPTKYCERCRALHSEENRREARYRNKAKERIGDNFVKRLTNELGTLEADNLILYCCDFSQEYDVHPDDIPSLLGTASAHLRRGNCVDTKLIAGKAYWTLIQRYPYENRLIQLAARILRDSGLPFGNQTDNRAANRLFGAMRLQMIRSLLWGLDNHDLLLACSELIAAANAFRMVDITKRALWAANRSCDISLIATSQSPVDETWWRLRFQALYRKDQILRQAYGCRIEPRFLDELKALSQLSALTKLEFHVLETEILLKARDSKAIAERADETVQLLSRLRNNQEILPWSDFSTDLLISRIWLAAGDHRRKRAAIRDAQGRNLGASPYYHERMRDAARDDRDFQLQASSDPTRSFAVTMLPQYYQDPFFIRYFSGFSAPLS